ncbi:MAG: hypothetical protein Q9214_001911, partial [Letrouitia sp. 1 TL-2023]
MKFLAILTAVLLLFETALAIPLANQESGNSLVRRAKDSGSKSKSKEKEKVRYRKIPGTSGKERFNEDAPARDKKAVEKMVRHADDYHDRHKRDYSPIRVSRDPPRRGRTIVHDETDSDSEPLTTGYLADDRGRDHTGAMYDKERRQPTSKSAKYRPESDEKHKKKRTLTLGGLQTLKSGDMREEKTSASSKLVPDNRHKKDKKGRKIGIPAATVYRGAQSTSTHQDSELVRKTVDRAKERGGRFRFASNPSDKFKKELESGSYKEIFPLRAPDKKGMRKPLYSQEVDDSESFGERGGLTSSSSSSESSSEDRSRSPRNQGSGLRMRSPRRRVRHFRSDSDSEDDRPPVIAHSRPGRPARNRKYISDSDSDKKVKRDIVDQTTKHQSDSDSQSPEGVESDAKTEYQDLVQSYDIARSNATDLIMPMLYEMVNGSNAFLIWDAAWEIASLADPSILI